jgi:hypothetical protein
MRSLLLALSRSKRNLRSVRSLSHHGEMLSAYGISSLTMCTLNYSSPSSAFYVTIFISYLTNEPLFCQEVNDYLRTKQLFF